MPGGSVTMWLEQQADDTPVIVLAASAFASVTVVLDLGAAMDHAAVAADLVHLARLPEAIG